MINDSSSNIEKSNEQSTDSKIAEYEATQQCFIHYDNFPWQIGTILVAGVFIFLGFLFAQIPSARIFNLGCFLIYLLMSTWLIYANYTYQIAHYKLHRIQELEKMLKMQQHLRFEERNDKQPYYKIWGLRGRHLNVAIYLTTSLGGPVIGYFEINCFQLGILLIHVALVLGVLIYIGVNSWRFSVYLNDLKEKLSSQ